MGDSIRHFREKVKSGVRNFLPKKKSIQAKFNYAFLLVSICPIILLQLINYSYSSTVLEDKIMNQSRNRLNLIAQNISTKIDSYDDVLDQLCVDDELVGMASKLDSVSNLDFYKSYALIRDKLDLLTFSKKGLAGITVVSQENNAVSSNNLASSKTILYDSKTLSRIYSETVHTAASVVDSIPFTVNSTDGEHHLIAYSKRIVDLKTLRTIGVAIVSIDENELYSAGNPEDTKKTPPDGYTFIVNDKGIIVSSPNKASIGQQMESESGKAFYENLRTDAGVFAGRPIISSEVRMDDFDWRLIELIDERSLLGNIWNMQRISMIVTILCVAVSLVISLVISRRFTASIRSVIQAMKAAQKGDYSIQVDLEQEDEIAAIAGAFNSMMQRINELVTKLNQQMHKVYRATQRQKEAEIRALEAQISPHFLYNTLDTINWMAIDRGEFEISDMLNSLASILRYSIDRSNEVVPIANEAAWLKKYLFLQKKRFNNAFDYSIIIPLEIQQCYTYKLMLQPFVENAILHGFSGRKEGGIIVVSAYRKGPDSIQFMIMDNGNGMDEETQREVNDDSNEEDGISKGSRSIGIMNVKNRLKMYFDKRATLRIISTLGKGTQVELTMPIMEAKTDDHCDCGGRDKSPGGVTASH